MSAKLPDLERENISLSILVINCSSFYHRKSETSPKTLSLTMAAASLHSLSLSLTPQTLCFVSASSLAPSSLKPLALPRPPLLSLSTPIPKFVRNVAISSELGEEVDEGEDEEASPQPNFSPELKLFVGNLPFTVDSSRLAGLFEQAGNVEMVEVIYDKATGRSRGFGFVTMSTVEEVEAAAQQFNGYELQGRALRVSSGPPPPRDENFSPRGPRGGSSIDNTNRLYVGNLAWGVDNLTLETLFSEQGKVKEATVVYDRDSGRSRGFGFVTYGSAQEVDNAIRSFDGMDLNGRSIRVSRAEARPKREY
ncbi:hypothetical protein SASPL_135989 [Salvia splendens]|uniref:RRM domain-containing protein n=2 Tax=Salvia splendens TaxID=180675 RepID=A0A8X8X159_SALSN|nr:hypothetical protein SASPL_135989 [Salvia splendens]